MGLNWAGNAMNINTGIFTAPKKGVYQFRFQTLHMRDETARYFEFSRNNESVSFVGCLTYLMPICSGQVTVHLNIGDSVKVNLLSGDIRNGIQNTVFSGRLIRAG